MTRDFTSKVNLIRDSLIVCLAFIATLAKLEFVAWRSRARVREILG